MINQQMFLLLWDEQQNFDWEKLLSTKCIKEELLNMIKNFHDDQCLEHEIQYYDIDDLTLDEMILYWQLMIYFYKKYKSEDYQFLQDKMKDFFEHDEIQSMYHQLIQDGIDSVDHSFIGKAQIIGKVLQIFYQDFTQSVYIYRNPYYRLKKPCFSLTKRIILLSSLLPISIFQSLFETTFSLLLWKFSNKELLNHFINKPLSVYCSINSIVCKNYVIPI